MARPRLPADKAAAIGADLKDPKRFIDRSAPKSTDLGPPPAHLSDFLDGRAVDAWHMFAAEMPWLSASDRTVLEIAARLRARMMSDPDMGVNALAQLRMCLSSMGGTPADRTKVAMPDEQDEDPAAEFLQ